MKKQIIFFINLLLTIHISAQDIKPDVLYKLVSPSGFVIDNMDSDENAANLFLSEDTKNKQGQLWKISKLPNGCYTFTNPFIDKSIDNDNITTGNGNPIIQWDKSPSNSNQ